jgi:hypothetical protein
MLLLGSHGLALGGDTGSGAPIPFEVARIHFEQNATDGDVEVVVEVEGGDEGMAKLAVVSPDGRTIIDVTAPDATTLGIRQFLFESPEPEDVESLKSAYPEGVYSFSGATVAGDKLHGESRLVHSLPDTTSILQPEPGARGVAASGLEITWSPIGNLSAYIINIEQDALNVSLTARLPGSATGFAVPDGFLRPGTKYELGIGSVGDDGNISFVESTFTTTGKK